ncbi:MAG: hypothetical protein PHF14_05675 [Verrucomicrobiota bacterium]|nr:hypothetical protein [Verrucomicrobiota bacterium]
MVDESVRTLYVDGDAQPERPFFTRYRIAGILFVLMGLMGWLDYQFRGHALGGVWLEPALVSRLLVSAVVFCLIGLLLILGIRRSPVIGLIWLLVHFAMSVMLGGEESLGSFFSNGLLALMLAPWTTTIPAWLGGVLFTLLAVFQAGGFIFFLVLLSKITAPGGPLVVPDWEDSVSGERFEIPEHWAVIRLNFEGLKDDPDSIFGMVLGADQAWAPSWLENSQAVLLPRTWVRSVLGGARSFFDESVAEEAMESGIGLISVHPNREDLSWAEHAGMLAQEAVETISMVSGEDWGEGVDAPESEDGEEGAELEAPILKEALIPIYALDEEGLQVMVFWTLTPAAEAGELGGADAAATSGVWDALIHRPAGIVRVRLVGTPSVGLLGLELLEGLLSEWGKARPADLDKVIPLTQDPVPVEDGERVAGLYVGDGWLTASGCHA